LTNDSTIFAALISITYDNYYIDTEAMRNKIVPLIGLLLFLSFCTKDKLDNLDYFAFGDAYGLCQGNCANFFIIKDGDIYPDDMDYYFESSLKFKSDALPVEKYDLANKLIDSFPTYLIDNPNKTFGCPDCVDQGGIHIEIKEKGQIKRWHFDTTISSLPCEIQDYVQEIAVVLEQLK
jgi:hypothetical protein